jgi:hypothetical protein
MALGNIFLSNKIRMVQHTLKNVNNEGKLAASFCHQVAVWFPDNLCNFYPVKNHKIAENSTTTKNREKN